MKTSDLIKRMATDARVSKKDAASVLRALVGAIRACLDSKDGHIRISGLGTFKAVDRKARRGRNPQTGAPITVPAARVPKFVPSQALRASAHGGLEGPVDVCATVEGPMKKILCKVCGLPAIGDLPFCREHRPGHV